MKLLLVFIINFAYVLVYAEQARFDNYRVYNLNVKTIDQLDILRSIDQFEESFDFWTNPVLGANTDLMVPPHKFADFEELMEKLKIKYQLKIKNVQNLIDNERPKIHPKAFGWSDYYTLEEIYSWLDEKLAAYPNILTNHVIGTSYQNRTIRAVKLSHNANNPVIFIESNIHANEWITSATTTWILNELLTSTNPVIQDMAQNFTWYILPVLNVDGFTYAHKTNRMWRKTRQLHAHLCYGTDPNRNWDAHWMHTGASSNPCSNMFAGPAPWSEPETRQLADFITKIANETKLYISFHSYSQLFMFPYGYTTNLTDNYDILTSIGNKTVEAIAVRYGTHYVAGPSATTIYETSGSSTDWVFDEGNVKLSLIFEFRDRGEYGFILPADQIIPNSLEIMDGLKAIIKQARVLNQF